MSAGSPADPVGPRAAGGPLGTGGRAVPAEWIDYNGHMMDAYYFVAFTEATEVLLDRLGLGAGYRAESGCGIYTAESHVCFRASARAGDELRYSSQLLGCDAKRLHVFHRMAAGKDGTDVATNELMFLHVDIAREKVTPMPPERRRMVAALAARHAALPVPDAAGRRIAMPGEPAR
jgi:acyl-CoA thioesterase FadM